MTENYEKDFVPKKLALALKKLGFDEPCLMAYLGKEKEPYLKCDDTWHLQAKDVLNPLKTPTYSQAFRWLLDKHYLYGIVLPTLTMNWTFKTMTVVEGMVEVPPYIHVDANDYSAREDAELECLKKLIEICQNKNQLSNQ